MIEIVFSASAVAISLFSLGWQIKKEWWERPVPMIDADLHPWADSDTLEPGWRATLTITNVGERPVTITDAGWWFGDGAHCENVERAEGVKQAFPFRLESNDQVKLAGFIEARSGWGGWREKAEWLGGRLYVSIDGEEYRGTKPFFEFVSRPNRFKAMRSGEGIKRVYATEMPIFSPFGGIFGVDRPRGWGMKHDNHPAQADG